MKSPLLSTYRAGENRITSSTMAVFERIDLALVQDLLDAGADAGGELRSVSFENQVVGVGSIPDACISGQFTWWFETKTTRGGYAAEGHDRDQLRHHSHFLLEDRKALLFALTPDPIRPNWLLDLDGVDESVRDRILWISFAKLAIAIDQVTQDPKRQIGEQTKFLLAELVALYEADGLLTNDDTVIVAARNAWPEYRKVGAYICQPDRVFREGLTYFGFYADGAIQPLIARIRAHYSSVLFTREEALQRRGKGDAELADLIDHQLDIEVRADGSSYGVLLLSGPDDLSDTVSLVAPIKNDTTANGRNWAWTLGQRYTSLEKLRNAVTTSDL
jgi:hypothetical protein